MGITPINSHITRFMYGTIGSQLARIKVPQKCVLSSDIRAAIKTDKRIGQALRNLLCGARPYVSIVWRSVAVDHMFLLCGARPYVSIVWRSAICFYCVCDHMFS